MVDQVLILNSQWQGWGVSDSIANGARELAHGFNSTPALEVPVPDYHDLATSDGMIGLDEQVAQIKWLLDQLDHEKPKALVQIAGDCGAQLGPVSWLNQQHGGRLNLIWVDAHADLNTPASSPSATFHGMVLRTLLGEGHPALTALVPTPIDPALVQLVGVRSLDDAERECISTTNQRTVQIADVAASGPVYVHIDLDSLDPAEFGHVRSGSQMAFSLPMWPTCCIDSSMIRSAK